MSALQESLSGEMRNESICFCLSGSILPWVPKVTNGLLRKPLGEAQ